MGVVQIQIWRRERDGDAHTGLCKFSSAREYEEVCTAAINKNASPTVVKGPLLSNACYFVVIIGYHQHCILLH